MTITVVEKWSIIKCPNETGEYGRDFIVKSYSPDCIKKAMERLYKDS